MFNMYKAFLAAAAAAVIAVSGGGLLSEAADESENFELPEYETPAEEQKDISKCLCTLAVKTFEFTGRTPSVKNYVLVSEKGTFLKSDIDYDVVWSDNPEIGNYSVKIIGKGSYSGEVTRNYSIVPKKNRITKLSARERTLHVEWTKDILADGYELLYSRDPRFTRFFSIVIDDTSVTSADISKNVTGGEKWYVRVRSYVSKDGTAQSLRSGVYSTAFGVNTRHSVRSLSVSGSVFSYTGKEITPEVTVFDENSRVVPADQYKITYSDNVNVGSPKITVSGTGKYTGTAERSFIIKPEVNEITSLTTDNGAFRVSWKKGTPGTVGYQVKYSTTADFSSNVHSYSSLDVNDLSENFSSVPKPGETWYVKVRSFYTADGRSDSTRYGDYSAVKSITTINYYAATSTGAYLYSTAHYSPEASGWVNAGTKVGILSQSGNWYRIYTDGRVGWVYGMAFGISSGVTRYNVGYANVAAFADDVLFSIGCTPSAIRYYTSANLWYNQGIPEYSTRDMNAAMAIARKSGRCVNYAALADLLLERAGFDHELIKGYQHSVYHNWNAYKYPGSSSWYYMECTPLNGPRLVTYGLTAQTLIAYNYVWDRSRYISG